MKSKKYTISFVSSESFSEQTARALSNRLPVKFSQISEVTELFPMLSNPKFNTDLIIVDIEQLFRVKGTDVFGIVNALSTLVRCTVQRTEPGKPQLRQTKIAASVSLNTDTRLIKEILGTSIDGLYPLGDKFSVDEKEEAISELLFGKFHIPKQIKEYISPKKSKVQLSDSISLTPRQEQILSLIKDRGASNKSIAKILDIAESTVKLHITQIFKKVGVRNRTQLAVFSR